MRAQETTKLDHCVGRKKSLLGIKLPRPFIGGGSRQVGRREEQKGQKGMHVFDSQQEESL